MLTEEMLLEAARLLAKSRRPCRRSEPCKDCDDCRAIELAQELERAAPVIRDSIWLMQKINECPGRHFEESRTCVDCNMHARYHKSDEFLTTFKDGLMKALRESL